MSPQVPYVSGPPDPYTGHLHAPLPPPPPKRRTGRRVALVVAAAVGLLALLLCGGTLVALLTSAGPPADPVFQDPATGAAVPAPTLHRDGATATPSVTPPVTPPAKAPVAAVGDGTWTAGTDFPAGRYEVTTQADLCAWQVYTGEQPDVQYVDPGHIGPGHYVFTFKAGQHLMTQGCGTWRKTG